MDEPPKSPCQPNPCGPNSECRLGPGTKAVCSCLPGYFGKPCRPECTIDSDCSLSKACVNYNCVDPCEGSCGVNAVCTVVSHRPSCSCPDDLTGNPYSKCYERGELAFLHTTCVFSFYKDIDEPNKYAYSSPLILLMFYFIIYTKCMPKKLCRCGVIFTND